MTPQDSEDDPSPRVCQVTAQLCVLNRAYALWGITWLPIRHDEGKGQELFWWVTDVVVPFGDSICWVDYLPGILFCGVFNKSPQLQVRPVACQSQRASVRSSRVGLRRVPAPVAERVHEKRWRDEVRRRLRQQLLVCSVSDMPP